jgi:hypothetical protein
LEEKFPKYLAANFGINWISVGLAIPVEYGNYQIAATEQRLD